MSGFKISDPVRTAQILLSSQKTNMDNNIILQSNDCIHQRIKVEEDVKKGHLLIPSVTNSGQARLSVEDYADRVIGVAAEDGLAGTYINMAIGGVFEVLVVVYRSNGEPDPSPSILVTPDYYIDQGNSGNGFGGTPGPGTPGVGTAYYGGEFSANVELGTFAIVNELKMLPFNTAVWPEPMLIKARFKKAEVY